MEDLSGLATNTHRVINGEALDAWIRSLLQNAVKQHGNRALMVLRDAIANRGLVYVCVFFVCMSPLNVYTRPDFQPFLRTHHPNRGHVSC